MKKLLEMLLVTLLISSAHGQDSMTIGITDFYGLQTKTESEVRELLPFKEGDSFPPFPPPNIEAEVAALEAEMATALGVSRVEIGASCCVESGVVTVTVGVEVAPRPGLAYRALPTGDAALPLEILNAYEEFETAWLAAVSSGNSGIDPSEGHALATNPEVRAFQEKFIVYAEQYREQLLDVLHDSADEKQRAIAAHVLGYVQDKAGIVADLTEAVLDPSEGVRNETTRALAFIAHYANEHPESNIEIQPDLYIEMLSSIFLGDRQKAGAVLLSLTSRRDPQVLAQLQERSLPFLIEMCRFKSDLHSYTPCKLLERVVGLPEQRELHPKETTIGMALELVQN